MGEGALNRIIWSDQANLTLSARPIRADESCRLLLHVHLHPNDIDPPRYFVFPSPDAKFQRRGRRLSGQMSHARASHLSAVVASCHLFATMLPAQQIEKALRLVYQTDDLRGRLAKARTKHVSSVRPRAAAPHPQQPCITLERPLVSLIQRIYRLPLIGYLTRVFTSVLNLPRIVENLSAHYKSHRKQVHELRALVAELRLQVEHLEAMNGMQSAKSRSAELPRS